MTLSERIAVLQRVADALAAVRSALAPLSADDRRAVLADVVAELSDSPPATAATVPATPPPVQAKRRSGPRPTGTGNDGGSSAPAPAGYPMLARRQMIARLISEKGPQRGTDIAKALGLGEGSVPYTVTHPWFMQGDDKRWAITDAGRQALAEHARGPGE